MKTIKNKTKKPLSVPLPGGKKLFLSPGKSGQIGNKAADHPPLLALVEADELEIVGEGSSSGEHRKDSSTGGSSGQGHMPNKTVFRSGDN